MAELITSAPASRPDSDAPTGRRRDAVARWGSAVGQRAAVLLVTLFVAATLIFALTAFVPGDVAEVIAGDNATTERVDEIRERLGFDRPLLQQYVTFLGDLVRGDLGESAITGESVTSAFARTYPRTLQIGVAAIIVSITLGLSLGIAAALRPRSWLDAGLRTVASITVATPSFWVGLVLVTYFALELRLLPATGFVSVFDDPVEGIRHTILPAMMIGIVGAGAIARQTRSAMLGALAADHARTQRALGYRSRSIVMRHGLRNAAIPIVTVIGLDIVGIIGGTVIAEQVFGISGLGTFIVNATVQRDVSAVRGAVIGVVFVVVIINMLIDLLYRALDPRIRG